MDARDAGAALIAAHPSGPATSEEPAGGDPALLARTGDLGWPGRPVRTDQRSSRLRLGGRSPTAVRPSRRLPLDRPSLWLENAPALRQGRAGDRRMSPIPCDAPSRAVSPRCRARPSRCLKPFRAPTCAVARVADVGASRAPEEGLAKRCNRRFMRLPAPSSKSLTPTPRGFPHLARDVQRGPADTPVELVIPSKDRPFVSV